ncbi:unnamed protein product, partial [marine sediment metagenome]
YWGNMNRLKRAKLILQVCEETGNVLTSLLMDPKICLFDFECRDFARKTIYSYEQIRTAFPGPVVDTSGIFGEGKENE